MTHLITSSSSLPTLHFQVDLVILLSFRVHAYLLVLHGGNHHRCFVEGLRSKTETTCTVHHFRVREFEQLKEKSQGDATCNLSISRKPQSSYLNVEFCKSVVSQLVAENPESMLQPKIWEWDKLYIYIYIHIYIHTLTSTSGFWVRHMTTEGTNLETNFGILNPLQNLLLYKDIAANSNFQLYMP